MPAPRKYDQETRNRAIRMYRDRRREKPDESRLATRTRVGELLSTNRETLRGWVERVEVDGGERVEAARIGVDRHRRAVGLYSEAVERTAPERQRLERDSPT